MSKMTVYHGSNTEVAEPEVRKGRYSMRGRESQRANAVFFVCSLIDYIARKTKNERCDIVESLGEARIGKLIDLADVYHSENIDELSDRLIDESDIAPGSFDNVGEARYIVPSHWDIGKVYKRLVLDIADDEHIGDAQAIMRAYAFPISPLLDNYNGSFYYGSPQAIYAAYRYGDLD